MYSAEDNAAVQTANPDQTRVVDSNKGAPPRAPAPLAECLLLC